MVITTYSICTSQDSTLYYGNVTPEECDKPHDYFYLFLSAQEQAQFNHQMDNPGLQHMNFCYIGLSKQECTQAFNNPPTPCTSSSQETKHHINYIDPTPNFQSSSDTEPITNTTSCKAILYQVYPYSTLSHHNTTQLHPCKLQNQYSSPRS
jgi:hypothetical protein